MGVVMVAEVSAGGVPTQAAVNATGELKLPNELTIIDEVTVEPALTTTVPVEASEKSAAVAVMTYKVKVAECDRGPLAPVTVSVHVPTGTLPGTNTVSVDEAVPPAGGVTGFVPKLPDAPDPPENESATGEAKLFCELRRTLTDPVDP